LGGDAIPESSPTVVLVVVVVDHVTFRDTEENNDGCGVVVLGMIEE
jgi:hypothetical protein